MNRWLWRMGMAVLLAAVVGLGLWAYDQGERKRPKIYEAGRQAGSDGAPPSACPHRDSYMRYDWMRGWAEGWRERTAREKKGE